MSIPASPNDIKCPLSERGLTDTQHSPHRSKCTVNKQQLCEYSHLFSCTCKDDPNIGPSSGSWLGQYSGSSAQSWWDEKMLLNETEDIGKFLPSLPVQPVASTSDSHRPASGPTPLVGGSPRRRRLLRAQFHLCTHRVNKRSVCDPLPQVL